MTSRQERGALFPLLLVNFIGTLGFTIVLPFLVALVTRLGGNALVYGMMGATYSAFQLVGAPILGRWSDTYGRRKILLLSQLGTLAAWCVFLVALFLPVEPLVSVDHAVLGVFVISLPMLVLFCARALDGLTGGNVSVANAYLADITSKDERKQNFGKMSVAANFGFILGPTLGGLLGSTSYMEVPPVIAAMLISAAASLVIWLYLPESRRRTLTDTFEEISVRKVFGHEQVDCVQPEAPKKTGWRQVFSLPCVGYLLAINFVIFLAFNFFYTAFPVYALQGLEWTVRDIGVFFSFIGLSMAIVQGPVLSRASKRFSDATLVVIGAAVLAIAFLLYSRGLLSLVYFGGLCFALGNGLMWPSFLALLSKQAGSRYQGVVQGFSGSVGSLASIIGLLVGGVLYGIVGGSVFLISAGLALIAAMMAMRFVGQDEEPDVAPHG